MQRPYDHVVLGLSLSSSWGNGHATTYRALLRGLCALGQRVLFLERRQPWYSAHCDLPAPDFCDLDFYDDLDELRSRHAAALRQAGHVMVGSYVPDGREVIDLLARLSPACLSFYDIDTPVTMAMLRRGEDMHLARRQVPLFAVYFSFSGGEVLDRLETEFGARRAVALYCSVDWDSYRPPAPGTQPTCDLGYMGTYSADRQPKLEALLIEPARRLPQMRFVVAGAQYPAGIDWPANVRRIEHLPPAAHPGFYGCQRFTLNVTRSDMVEAGWSPSVRLFEAAACGTPIISDAWRGLDEVLPEGEAVLVARDTDDVVRFLTGVDDHSRRTLASSARARVASAHTGTARARALLDALGQAMPRAATVA